MLIKLSIGGSQGIDGVRAVTDFDTAPASALGHYRACIAQFSAIGRCRWLMRSRIRATNRAVSQIGSALTSSNFRNPIGNSVTNHSSERCSERRGRIRSKRGAGHVRRTAYAGPTRINAARPRLSGQGIWSPFSILSPLFPGARSLYLGIDAKRVSLRCHCDHCRHFLPLEQLLDDGQHRHGHQLAMPFARPRYYAKSALPTLCQSTKCGQAHGRRPANPTRSPKPTEARQVEAAKLPLSCFGRRRRLWPLVQSEGRRAEESLLSHI